MGFLDEVAEEFQARIIDEGKLGAFIVLTSFLLTFAAVRALAHAVRRQLLFARNIEIADVHVHHLVPGIALLLLTGYLTFAFGYGDRPLLAAMFGVGAALTLDEFALWLHLRDVYWSHAGRRSVHVVLTVAAIGGLVVIGLDFWEGAARAVAHLFSGR
jgi:hypothetical protein